MRGDIVSCDWREHGRDWKIGLVEELPGEVERLKEALEKMPHAGEGVVRMIEVKRGCRYWSSQRSYEFGLGVVVFLGPPFSQDNLTENVGREVIVKTGHSVRIGDDNTRVFVKPGSRGKVSTFHAHDQFSPLTYFNSEFDLGPIEVVVPMLYTNVVLQGEKPGSFALAASGPQAATLRDVTPGPPPGICECHGTEDCPAAKWSTP